jgi:hypothetical protein
MMEPPKRTEPWVDRRCNSARRRRQTAAALGRRHDSCVPLAPRRRGAAAGPDPRHVAFCTRSQCVRSRDGVSSAPSAGRGEADGDIPGGEGAAGEPDDQRRVARCARGDETAAGKVAKIEPGAVVLSGAMEQRLEMFR